jgi:hypothetical protein
MEDPSLSSVPVAERAWPNLRTFAALSPPPDFTHGTLDPANQFSQFMRHVVRQLQMCGLYTDEDVLRWLVNFDGRQSRYLPVQPQDFLVLRCFAVLCAEMPDVVCRHWDMPTLYNEVAQYVSGRPQRTDLGVLQRAFAGEGLAALKVRIAEGLRYASPLPYSATEEQQRKRPRDTNVVTPTLSYIA